MLSIIIPSYNYPVYDLVNELYSQCTALAIPFEIIVRDDCSKNQFSNFNINKLKNCSYSISNRNMGLAQTRNFLVSQTQYSNILLLDNDVFPTNNNYIENYLKEIDNGFDIYYGGIAYKKNTVNKNEKLRWVYGIAREELTAIQRSSKSLSLFLSSNTLIKKHVFNIVTYDNTIVKYGYEDLLFSKLVFENKLKVKHLNNNVWHLKLDTSKIYLQKSETALQTLKMLINSQKLDFNDTGISKMYIKLKRKKAMIILRFLSKIFCLPKILKRNLLSNNPKMKYFDLYRLLYFDQLMNN